jgi:hypothetical protein
MFLLYVLPIVVQVVVPFVLLGWQTFGAERDRAEALLKTLAVGAYLVAIASAGLWLIVPWPLSIAYLFVFGTAAGRLLFRIHSVPWWPWQWREWLSASLAVVLVALSVTLISLAWAGRRPPGEQIVDLAFPLSDGTYYIVAGGSTELLNPHLQTLAAERFRRYRGQSYGIDIVKLNGLGMRASGPAPRDPRQYAIFGDSIKAPCSGTVLRTGDGLPDMSPPRTDREQLPGNFVFVQCREAQVLLGHMQRGTVRVRVGEDVTVGDVVGNVGNSGNTGEPHLHIHAQRPATSDAFLSGEPLPIRLDGRFLVRNDQIRKKGPSDED